MSKVSSGSNAKPEADTPVFKGANSSNFPFTDQQRWTPDTNAQIPYLPEAQKRIKTPMILHIKLAPNVIREVRCFDDDDPQALAIRFCNENNLPPELIPVVQNMIQAQFSQATQKKSEKSNKNSTSKVSKTSPHVSSPNQDYEDHQRNDTQRLEVSNKESSYTNDRSRQSPGPRPKQKKPKLIAKMNVNITPHESKELLLYEGEDPAEVGYRFYSENKLPPQFAEILTKQLINSQEQYYLRKDKQSDTEGSIAKADAMRNEPPQLKKPERSNPIEPYKFVMPTENKDKSKSAGKTRQASPPKNKEVINSIAAHEEVDSIGVISKEPSHHAIRAEETPERAPMTEISSSASIEKKSGTDVAETYERWQNLLKSKRKIKQFESEFSPSPEGRSSFGRRSSRSRSKEPRKDVNANGLYKLALKTLNPSREKSPRATIIQPDRIQGSDKRKLTRDEEEEIVTRLYQDAKNRKAQKDELQLYEIGVRTFTDPKFIRRSPSPWKNEEEPLDLGDHSLEMRGGSKYRKEKELIAQEKLRKENFTFKPTISEASKLLAENRNRSTSPVYDKLYANGKAIKKDRELLQRIALEETCSFRPQIIDSEAMEPGYLERVAKRRMEARQKKLMADTQEIQSPIDPKTGQKLFTPVIKKDKYYYKLKEEEEKALNESKASRLLEKSGKTSKALREIFDKLDHDKDGYVSAKSIEISGLSVETLGALMDVFEVIENQELNLDFLGFVQLVQRTLSMEKQNILEGFGMADVSRQEILFTPSKREEKDENSKKGSVILGTSDYKSRNKSPSAKKVKGEEVERVNPSNLTKHYQRLLTKKDF